MTPEKPDQALWRYVRRSAEMFRILSSMKDERDEAWESIRDDQVLSEARMLGYLMQDPPDLDDHLAQMKEKNYETLQFAMILNAIRALRKEGARVSAVGVAAILARRGHLAHVGGLPTLREYVQLDLDSQFEW